MAVRLPEPPETLDIQTQEFLRSFLQALELEIDQKATTPFTRNTFKNTGTLTKRFTIDQSTATLAELRDYVATLVDELRSGGYIA